MRNHCTTHFCRLCWPRGHRSMECNALYLIHTHVVISWKCFAVMPTIFVGHTSVAQTNTMDNTTSNSLWCETNKERYETITDQQRRENEPVVKGAGTVIWLRFVNRIGDKMIPMRIWYYTKMVNPFQHMNKICASTIRTHNQWKTNVFPVLFHSYC